MPDPALIAAAVETRTRAYAPYSRFLVGAAIKDEVGRIHSGCNVENAAYPQGTCAEAGAIAAMVLAGGHKIVEVAIEWHKKLLKHWLTPLGFWIPPGQPTKGNGSPPPRQS